MTGPVLRLLVVLGVLRVRVCQLCACLVAADGAAQHARQHQAIGPNGPGPWPPS